MVRWLFKSQVIFALACGGAQPIVKVEPVVVEKIVTVTVTERCAKFAPPVFVKTPKPSVSADRKMICYASRDAANLKSNIQRALEWIRDTWILCAPTPPNQ